MGYAPDLWGPSTWHTIHLLCYTAPTTLSASEQLRYTAFFKALPFVLPCATCSEHLQAHYTEHPVENYVGSQASLFEWSVHVHNAVNKMLGKPEVSLETATSIWSNHLKMDASSGSSGIKDADGNRLFGVPSSKVYAILLVVIALFGVGAAVYLTRREWGRGQSGSRLTKK